MAFLRFMVLDWCVSSNGLNVDFQRNCWWKLNNILVMFLMKPHYHSVGLLELHQCRCEWEGISNKILYRDNRNSHGLWFTFIEWKSKEYWLWNTNLWDRKRKFHSLTGLNLLDIIIKITFWQQLSDKTLVYQDCLICNGKVWKK